MEMHPYYTEIPLRSFQAIVRNGLLSEILLALITDPLEAVDLAERLERPEKGKQIWVLPADKSQRRYPAPTSVEDFRELNIEAKASWRVTMAQLVMRFDQSMPALLFLTRYDQKLGVWATCQVAREAINAVPKAGKLVLPVVRITEAWVRGKATGIEVTSSAAKLRRSAPSFGDDEQLGFAFYAAWYAARSVEVPSNVEIAAVRSANAIAYHRNLRSKLIERRDAELVRLREVIANACMTFPM